MEYSHKVIKNYEYFFKYARKICRNEELAKDITQSVVLSYLEKEESYHDKSENYIKKSMLFSIKNRVIDIYRNNHKHQKSLIDVADFTNLYSNVNTDSRVLVSDIENSISKLPKDLARMVKLRSIGYQYHEIAEILLCPIGTIKSYMHRAKSKLNNHLN